MFHAAEHYEAESKRALEAAERASTLSERISLFETAIKYAQLACSERKRMNVYKFGPARK
jgi:hypothetical protein